MKKSINKMVKAGISIFLSFSFLFSSFIIASPANHQDKQAADTAFSIDIRSENIEVVTFGDSTFYDILTDTYRIIKTVTENDIHILQKNLGTGVVTETQNGEIISVYNFAEKQAEIVETWEMPESDLQILQSFLEVYLYELNSINLSHRYAHAAMMDIALPDGLIYDYDITFDGLNVNIVPANSAERFGVTTVIPGGSIHNHVPAFQNRRVHSQSIHSSVLSSMFGRNINLSVNIYESRSGHRRISQASFNYLRGDTLARIVLDTNLSINYLISSLGGLLDSSNRLTGDINLLMNLRYEIWGTRLARIFDFTNFNRYVIVISGGGIFEYAMSFDLVVNGRHYPTGWTRIRIPQDHDMSFFHTFNSYAQLAADVFEHHVQVRGRWTVANF